MTQRLQSRTWSWLTKITGTAIVTTVFVYCLADAYAALPRLVFGIIATATTYVLLIGRILLSTRQVRHLHLAVDGLVNMRRLSVIAGNRNWSNIANSNKS
ncbi:hypothetical protein C5H23_06340 [Xylella fastidiosa]|nr:hypothetical protein P303_08465 [Xylella fastidiosa MUL0034]EWG15452.1 hypothetical protein P910_001275 [Xylella fastidiosa Mul-MD]KFA41313.1 hypothetical protein DF22_001892 [Xylella fastidiosa]TNV89380.1 hypothetical protein C5H23_06340 [Xylella fastidiosa]TNV99003.1 hypothetical protein C5H21_06310 [Xylella fastidiosa]